MAYLLFSKFIRKNHFSVKKFDFSQLTQSPTVLAQYRNVISEFIYLSTTSNLSPPLYEAKFIVTYTPFVIELLWRKN